MTSEDEKTMFIPGSSVHDTVFPPEKNAVVSSSVVRLEKM